MDTPLNKFLVGVLVVLVGMIGYRALHPSTSFAADGTDPRWDAAAQEAHASGRPSIVLFTADWCPACRALHANFHRDDVSAELDHYYLHTVSLTNPTPAAQEHARKFGADYIPLLIRYDTDGKETARTNSLPPDELVKWLKEGE